MQAVNGVKTHKVMRRGSHASWKQRSGEKWSVDHIITTKPSNIGISEEY